MQNNTAVFAHSVQLRQRAAKLHARISAASKKANDLVQLSADVCALAERACGEARRAREASSDARIQRSVSINCPAVWADMMVAWVFARARMTTLPMRAERGVEWERALQRWRFALDQSPVTRTGRTTLPN